MYRLHSLGWSSFQQLCLTITREILGQTVESFLDSHDGGRDGAFTGKWRTSNGDDLTGTFVIQCKFTGKLNHQLQVHDLTDELEKVRRLVEANICDTYILMTNAGVTGTRAAEIEALLSGAGAKHVRIFDSTWITQQIRENRRLRMLVPRVYGLGDLSQILDERAYLQSRTILESMREDLAKVVLTDAYRRAVYALNEHSFVLLIGEPAAGKTTIASLLAMAALDQWNASTLKLDNPGHVTERWNPLEPSQFFWLDDAFGVTQYEEFLVHSWNHILPQIKPMLRKGAKIVMTSRDYIYNRARRDLKEGAFPLLSESQVVINVHDLSLVERSQILYNHLKLGRQPLSFRRRIKPYLEDIANNPEFVPETARRLADPFFTKDLILFPYFLKQFVERREQHLREVLRGLNRDDNAALALIYMRNGKLDSPIALGESETEAIVRLGSNLGGCIAALAALDGSLVVHTHTGGESFWRFKHPTIGDAYAESLVHNPEMLGIYIRGSSPDKLIEQVTCGEVGIERATVVPTVLFPLMLEKLSKLTSSKEFKTAWLADWQVRCDLQHFLSKRCSKDFLSLYLEQNPDLMKRVAAPGLFLGAVPEVQLAKRLHELGMLPEEERTQFVRVVSSYAIRGEDFDAIDDKGIRTLFTDEEYGELIMRVRAELLPRLVDVRLEWQSDYNGDSPEEHMEHLLGGLKALTECFADDKAAVENIEDQIQRTNQWIADNEQEESDHSSQQFEEIEAHEEQPQGQRSIFDDIDTDEI